MRDSASTGSVLESLLAWDPSCSPTNGNMSLPVSSYEELLARVRNLTHETIQLQRELTTPLANSPSSLNSLQLDQNLNERLLAPTDEAACDKFDNTRGGGGGLTNGTWASSPSPTATAASTCSSQPRRPNTFQRPLSFHGNGSKPVNRKSSSSRRTYENDDFGDARALLLLLGKQPTKQKENGMEPKEEDEKRTELKKEPGTETDVVDYADPMASSSTESVSLQNVSTLYHGTWPVERGGLWNSCGPSSVTGKSLNQQDTSSVMSFSSSVGSSATPIGSGPARRTYSQHQLTSKVDMVYSLLSMLGTHENREDMTKTLLAMSSSADSCQTMRQSGCLPLLVQFIHVAEHNAVTRAQAAEALHNLVHAQPDDKRGRREVRVLRLLEQLREYCDSLRGTLQDVAAAEDKGEPIERPALLDEMEKHPGASIAALMKLSFDEEHRHAMCQLGGLHAVAELIQLDHEAHGSASSDQHCVTLRRYAGMALTNLTFGDGTNKALLCSFREFMKALVAQLNSPSEDLRQVTASVLRNLSWRADGASKQTLREVGAVPGLMWAAIDAKKESTLKSILSALWNLSAHCSLNKVDICAVDGALGFLIGMLSYKAPSKTLAIVENAGGILRNISSHIAIREDYRGILRHHNCLQVLLQQLKSPSLTIVSNACGTLWNLSARCPEDQKALWDMGAVNMLRSLVHSKHKMISMGSSAALKNLLGAKPNNNFPLDSTSKQFGLPVLPSLFVRKQKALEQELDENLSETCDNIEPSTSPSGLRDDKFVFSATERLNIEERHKSLRSQYQSQSAKYPKSHVSRSDSRDSVTSTLSDTVYERVSRTSDVIGSSNGSGPGRHGDKASSVHGGLTDADHAESHPADCSASDKRFLSRYSTTMKERDQRRKVLSLEITSDNTMATSLERSSVELGSPYSRLGHSDDVYLEKNRDCRRVRERVKESLTTSANAEPRLTERDGKAKGSKPTFDNPKTPYMKRSAYPRNKFSDLEMDSGVQEEPVDYSLKYVEPNQAAAAVKAAEPVEEPAAEKKNENDLGRGFAARKQERTPANKNMKMNVVYGDYAETDLDQPTDYSLKYPEEDDDLEFEENVETEAATDPQFYEGTSPVHEDTLKTYYTEGTPYETPYNFSTATSMSDLHIEPAVPDEKKPVKGEPAVVIKTEPSVTNFHDNAVEKEHQVKVLPASTTPPKLLQSGISSGLMSPDKPVPYYEEGTPGSFSRVSSLSSLNSIPVHAESAPAREEIAVPPVEAKPAKVAAAVKDETCEHFEKDEPREGKMVTFGSTDHYAEETPLMFSRCSSLGSLSSFDQHSIHDDRSSVVSDFSRRTSGIVSPSELPDSPTQTVPPSPRRTDAPVSFPGAPETSAGGRSVGPRGDRQAPKASVFEDDVAAFKEEDTPVEFSRATSLSSLTIDDEPKIPNDTPHRETTKLMRTVVPAGIHHTRRAERDKEDGMEKQDVEKEKRESADCCELAPVSEGEEDDEDMLAACINIGMQNSRQKYNTAPPRSSRPALARVRPAMIGGKNLIRPVNAASGSSNASSPDTSTKSINVDLPGACEDALLSYCTEGTPANISNAGSHSDLSILSFACDRDDNESHTQETCQPVEEEDEQPQDLERRELSDDSSNFSGDNDNILAECIQSGMPKARSRRLLSPLGGENDGNAATALNTAPGPVPRRQHLYEGAKIASRNTVPFREQGPLRLPLEGCENTKPAHGIAARDEFETYATEGSPHTFSTRSSLSDLTVSTEGGPGVASCLKRAMRSRPLSEGTSCDSPLRFATEDTPLDVSHAASLSSLSCGDTDEIDACGHQAGGHQAGGHQAGGHPTDWDRPENSPASKLYNKTGSVSEDVVTVLSRNGSLSSLSVDSFGSTDPSPSEQALLEQCINSGMPKSKTTRRVATNRSHSDSGSTAAAAFDIEHGMNSLSLSERGSDGSKNGVATSAAKTRLLNCTVADAGRSSSAAVQEINHQDREERKPLNKTEKAESVRKPEEEANLLKLDIEVGMQKQEAEISKPKHDLETYVEAQSPEKRDFVSLADAGQKEEKKGASDRESNMMKQSTEKSTWDEDISPNDVSFPSISSAPALPSNLESCSDAQPVSMTDSKKIEAEAEKLTAVFRIEGRSVDEMEQSMVSLNSLNSMDLDGIKQPSMMDSLVSLTASVSEMGDTNDRKCNSSSLNIQRGRQSIKKQLPAGVMVRRALGASHNSMECMLENVSITSTTSQIDNVKPPWGMDEMMDLADMENSMISVASITSEVADVPKDHRSDSPTPGNSYTLEAKDKFSGDTSEIDNVQPPSALNDLTDMTMEPGSETMCSDTEIAEDPALTHTIDELPSDSSARNTPFGSELSSAESTPKKRQKHRLLTPRQKRQMGKDRYRTYTISAEEERQLELIRQQTEEAGEEADGCETTPPQSSTAKPTPKQRRLEDRSRFETRVLDRTYSIKSESKSSGIPKPGVKKNIKTLKEKRAAAGKERFRTQTLSGGPIPTADQMGEFLQRDADLVISTLNATRHHSESDDMMLDCETLSLISLDSESEHNSRKKSTSRLNVTDNDLEDRTLVEDSSTPLDVTIVAGEMACDDQTIDDQTDEEREALGPKITKPSSRVDCCDDIKGIRGRRKPLYVASSQRPGGQGLGGLAKPRAAASATAPGPVRATRASALRQVKVNAASALVRLTSKATAEDLKLSAPARSMKVVESASDMQDHDVGGRFRPPERQGTFTKEDSGTQPGCIPVSPSKTRIPVPATTPTDSPSRLKLVTEAKKKEAGKLFKIPLALAPKVKLTRELSQPAPSKMVTNRLAKTRSLDNASKLATTGGGLGTKLTLKSNVNTIRHQGVAFRAGSSTDRKNNGFGIRTSVSNQSLRSQLSVSNSSINSVGSVGKGTARVPKKEVTSKIASLWKRVEEIQVQNRFPKKDTRVWITAESKTDERNVTGAQQKLVRSSTFDGVTPKTNPVKTSAASGKKTVDLKAVKPSSGKVNDGKGLHPATKKQDVQGDEVDTESTEVVSRRKKPMKTDGGDADETTQRMSRLGSFFRIEAQEIQDGKPAVPKGPASAIVPPYNYSPPPRATVSSHIPAPVKLARTLTPEADLNEDLQVSTASKKVTSV